MPVTYDLRPDIILEALPAAAYHEIERCGHLMSVDQPAAYAAALASALGRPVR